MNTLFVLCGIPGSGKSTFARKYLARNMYYVSRDEVRYSIIKDDEQYFSQEKKVFNQFVSEVAMNLASGDTIADATHISKASRRKLISALDRTGIQYDIIFITFPTDVNQCIERNKLRTGRAHVPDDAIYRMNKNLEWPTALEDPRIKGIWTIKGEF